MLFILSHSVKRLVREGAKSLSVPLIALVFIILINLLGGIKAWLEEEYADTMENFPIIAVVSDLSGGNTDQLRIGVNYITFFTDPDRPITLADHTGDPALKRTFNDAIIPGFPETVQLTGVTFIDPDNILGGMEGTVVTFYEGFDESIFFTDEMVCMISEDLFELVQNGMLPVFFAELKVIGTVAGAGYKTIIAPFWTVCSLLEKEYGIAPHSESLSVRVEDNNELSVFKQLAALSFSRTRPFGSRPFAMTVYDSVFYETLEYLRRNIIVIDAATPFIYLLSTAVGFLTSVLLTRRRKAEFAVMRSVGVHKRVIFFSALVEQAFLSMVGVVTGVAFVAAIWGYVSLTRPAVFLACYLLGAIFAARSAAVTNVLKVLRDKGE